MPQAAVGILSARLPAASCGRNIICAIIRCKLRSEYYPRDYPLQAATAYHPRDYPLQAAAGILSARLPAASCGNTPVRVRACCKLRPEYYLHDYPPQASAGVLSARLPAASCGNTPVRVRACRKLRPEYYPHDYPLQTATAYYTHDYPLQASAGILSARLPAVICGNTACSRACLSQAAAGILSARLTTVIRGNTPVRVRACRKLLQAHDYAHSPLFRRSSRLTSDRIFDSARRACV